MFSTIYGLEFEALVFGLAPNQHFL